MWLKTFYAVPISNIHPFPSDLPAIWEIPFTTVHNPAFTDDQILMNVPTITADVSSGVLIRMADLTVNVPPDNASIQMGGRAYVSEK